jgi:NTE family protein
MGCYGEYIIVILLGGVNIKADGVFEGGGVKAVGLVGALCYIDEHFGIEWQSVAGTSAGAVIAALLAVGYTVSEIRDILLSLDFTKLQDVNWFSQLGTIGQTISLLWRRGIYKGDYLETLVADLMAQKGVVIFGDLRNASETDPRYQFKLNVIASDVTRGKMMILPRDIAEYGFDPEKLNVAQAIRMSISIPFYYIPYKFQYSLGGVAQISYVVDGGLLSNYPVWIFDAGSHSSWPTFGFQLIGPQDGNAHKTNNIIQYAQAMLDTMLEAHDAKYIQISDFKRTIAIPTLGIGSTDFAITPEQKQALLNSGYNAAKNFFSMYSFDPYQQSS